jgi:uncharacterized repeat protein (TIGR03806 family)
MKSKKYTFIALILLFPALYIISCYDSGRKPIESQLVFKIKLSAYGLFDGSMSKLEPVKEVEIMEISSSLFTDYALKQRLIKIPKGKQVQINGSDLPIFPDGTIIAKTFYYHKIGSKENNLVETRLLILKNSHWNAATYRWNMQQNDALLIKSAAQVPISFTDPKGKIRNISYQIPAQKECGSCHRSNNELIPIGPKIRNLNVKVIREGIQQNQLDYFIKKKIFRKVSSASVAKLPNYSNVSTSIEERARAYLDINCAHCHNPTGMAARQTLNLDFSVPLNQTGINFNHENIVMRMVTMGEYHMPKLGTTILDDEGVALIRAYIKQLP